MYVHRCQLPQQNQHRCPDRLSPWVHLHQQQQSLLPLSTALPTPSGAPTVSSRGRGWFIWGKGLECPWLCPHLPQPPPHPKPSAEPLYPPPPQLPHGAGDSPPLWRAEGAMTDSTDGAWKSPAKTSALWRNKEPGSHREKYGWKREGWGEGRQREGCKKGWRGGRRRKRARGRRRWCLFKEGGVPKRKGRVCLSKLGLCECFEVKNVQVWLFHHFSHFLSTWCPTWSLRDRQPDRIDLTRSPHGHCYH